MNKIVLIKENVNRKVDKIWKKQGQQYSRNFSHIVFFI